MEKFPTFKQGDPLSKLTNHSLLNNLFNAVQGQATRTLGTQTVSAGNSNYLPVGKESLQVKLVKVVDFEAFTGSETFKGPLGEVNVIEAEIIDAMFAEEVGTQAVSQLDATPNIIYAAAPPDFTAAVDDFIWVARFSHQWWVLVGGGGSGGGSEYIIFTVIDVLCDDADGRRLLVEAIRISPPCSTPSGLDSYGQLEVFDTKGCILNQYADDELIGITGDAMYTGNVATESYCEEEWSLLSLCYSGACT